MTFRASPSGTSSRSTFASSRSDATFHDDMSVKRTFRPRCTKREHPAVDGMLQRMLPFRGGPFGFRIEISCRFCENSFKWNYWMERRRQYGWCRGTELHPESSARFPNKNCSLNSNLRRARVRDEADRRAKPKFSAEPRHLDHRSLRQVPEVAWVSSLDTQRRGR